MCRSIHYQSRKKRKSASAGIRTPLIQSVPHSILHNNNNNNRPSRIGYDMWTVTRKPTPKDKLEPHSMLDNSQTAL